MKTFRKKSAWNVVYGVLLGSFLLLHVPSVYAAEDSSHHSMEKISTDSVVARLKQNQADIGDARKTLEKTVDEFLSKKSDPKILFQMSIGLELLQVIEHQLDQQMQQGTIESSSASSYYAQNRQWSDQNRNHLLEALSYLEEIPAQMTASSPSREEMDKLRQQIPKLAQAIVKLNRVSEDFTQQAQEYGERAEEALVVPPKEKETFSLVDTLYAAAIVCFALVIISLIGLTRNTGKGKPKEVDPLAEFKPE